MKKVVVITGSARPNSVNKIVVEQVKARLDARDDAEYQVADLVELNLPFYDGATPPSMDGFEIPHDNVKQFSQMVADADVTVLVVPEYNHGLTGIQKNAIDWLYKEWQDKPVAVVAYGAYAGKNSIAQLEEIATVTKYKLADTKATFKLGEEFAYDGTVVDQAAIDTAIDATLAEVLA